RPSGSSRATPKAPRWSRSTPSRWEPGSGLAEDEPRGEEQVSPEELLRQVQVSDLVLGTLVSLVQLGYAKLRDGERDQARLGIEVLRAVMPVIEEAAPADAVRDLRQATANLQLAYASKINEPTDEEKEEEK